MACGPQALKSQPNNSNNSGSKKRLGFYDTWALYMGASNNGKLWKSLNLHNMANHADIMKTSIMPWRMT